MNDNFFRITVIMVFLCYVIPPVSTAIHANADGSHVPELDQDVLIERGLIQYDEGCAVS